MPRSLSCLLGILIAGLLVGGPMGYAYYRHGQVRNFRAVREGVLFRSGQMSLPALREAIHDHGIRTVISLRPDDPAPDLAEEVYCQLQGIHFVRIPPRTWCAPDGSVPAEFGVLRFLKIMDEPRNYPVLIHCFAGIHRSGAFCAIYRMEYDHWTNEEAVGELRRNGYRDLDDEWDLLDYLEQYRPRWSRAQGMRQGVSPGHTTHPSVRSDTSGKVYQVGQTSSR